MTMIFNRLLSVVQNFIKLSAAVHELWCWQRNRTWRRC